MRILCKNRIDIISANIEVISVNIQFLKSLPVSIATIEEKVEFLFAIIQIEASTRLRILTLSISKCGRSVKASGFIFLCFEIDNSGVPGRIIFCRWITHDFELINRR